MAFSVSLLFVAFGAIMACFTLSYFEKKYTEIILNQQSAVACSLALGIDDELRMAQSALTAATSKIGRDLTLDRDNARIYLKNRPSLLALFDDGIFLLTKEGKLIAESSDLPHRPGGENPFPEFARQTLAKGKPYISNHYISTHLPENPAIFMTAPIFDKHGRPYAILGGSIDLLGKNLVNDISRIRVGKSGWVALCDRDGTIIAHTDRKRIMQRVPAAANRLFDRAVAGFDVSGKTTTSQGIPVFISYKQLAANDWFVGADLPQEEGYAPLYQARRYFLMAAVAGTSVTLICVWLLMRRLTSPLVAMTGHVQNLQKKSGSERLIPIDTGGEIGTLAGAFNDMITAIERQQDVLRESERRFHETLKNVRLLAMMIDRGGYIIFCNDFLLEVTGYRRDEIQGRDFFERLIPADTRDEIRTFFLPTADSDGTTCFCENKIRTSADEMRTIRWNNTPLRDSSGKLVGISSIGEDITDRTKAVEEIKNLNSTLHLRALELTGMNKELECFSYSVSHDLRTPLTGISIAAECLADDYAQQLDENGRFLIKSIETSCKRMDEQIDGMLELSRLTRRELCMKRIDLSLMAENVLMGLRMADPERRVQYSITPGLAAWGDENLLQAVLQNLIGNAWKYTGKTAEPFIEIGCTEIKGKRAFFVRDNGAGFDMKEADRLFQPFQRLHSGKEFAGTGIGLATVQRILDRHKGKVWAEGAGGKGATFYFTLPGRNLQAVSPTAGQFPAGPEK